jgi:hypothetical protein
MKRALDDKRRESSDEQDYNAIQRPRTSFIYNRLKQTVPIGPISNSLLDGFNRPFSGARNSVKCEKPIESIQSAHAALTLPTNAGTNLSVSFPSIKSKETTKREKLDMHLIRDYTNELFSDLEQATLLRSNAAQAHEKAITEARYVCFGQ